VHLVKEAFAGGFHKTRSGDRAGEISHKASKLLGATYLLVATVKRLFGQRIVQPSRVLDLDPIRKKFMCFFL